VVIVQIITGAVQGVGYFVQPAGGMNYPDIWSFIAIVSVTGISLATFIHERKKSAEALSRTTAQLEKVSETAQVGGWELDLETKKLWFSEEALRISELPAGTLLSISEAIEFISDPEEQAAHAVRVKNAMEHLIPWDAEYEMTTSTGRKRWIRSQGAAQVEGGRVVGLSGTVQDLSQRKTTDFALRESEERLRTIFRTLTEGVALNELVLDETGRVIDYRILEVNEAFYHTADFDPAVPVVGALATDLYKMPAQTVMDFYEAHRNSDTTMHVEFTSSRSGRIYAIATSPFFHGHFVTSFRDISDQKRSENALRESELRYRKLVESSADAIIVQENDVIIYVNPAAVRILKAKSAAEIIGKKMGMLLEEHQTVNDDTPGEIRVNTTKRLTEGKFHCLDSTTLEVEISASETVYNERPATLIVARDISERKRAEEKIRYLGQHDILTGLPNRSLFADRLAQSIAFSAAHKSEFALMFLDIDHFKKINDSLGHDVGDLFLKEMTARLKACVKPTDTVSRQGGDEFLMLLNELSHAEDVAQVAQRICLSLSKPLTIDGSRIQSSVSIGIAIYPRDGEKSELLVKNADIAMYHAKRSGRNQFQYFSEELNQTIRERLEMEAALSEAISAGQLEVYYQPQLDLRTGKITSCEALLRWHHPEWGMVPPNRFIPLAEETGRILEIGRWVMNTVARQYRDFESAGFPNLRISANVSAKEIQNGEFVAQVERILQSHGMPADKLEIEVTESMILKDAERAIAAIEHLSGLGVQFSIDDFGTGYSSLSYLRRLKIHSLKIDQSFVRDILTDPDDAAIVRTIIGLAKNLRLSVVAEGVEEKGQQQFLKENGCDIIQGYELSKPLPYADMLAFLKDAAT
jgi:diguanylate cyclase (GGDEF)-like protein/PAS domain S-box-containing protein